MEARALAGLLARLNRSGEVLLAPEKTIYLKDYLECRTAAKGGRVLRCDDCGTYAVAYNCCNRRGCPVCSRKNQMNWQVRMRERLLPTEHHHLVFSVPEPYTQKWLKHPRATVTQLFAGVRKVIHRLEKARSITVGTMMVFQSHCQGMAYKAHVHCLVSAGGLDGDDQWSALGVLPLARMTRWMIQAMESDERRGWRIHESRHQAGGEAVVQYLGQRLNGSVVSAKEVRETTTGQVVIANHSGTTELSASTFVQRYLNHIPQKGTVLVRNCGLYSNRQKKRRELARTQLGGTSEGTTQSGDERCPRCHGLLTTIMNTRHKPLLFDHERLGFANGPPIHWELSHAS